MHRNIPELVHFFCLIFSDIKMLFFGLSFILYVLQLSGRNGFKTNTIYTIIIHKNESKITRYEEKNVFSRLF